MPLTSSLSLMTFSSRYSTSRFSAILVVQFSRLLVTSICRLLKLFSASSTACTEDFVSRYGSTIYAAAASRFSFKNSIENKNQFQFNFFFFLSVFGLSSALFLSFFFLKCLTDKLENSWKARGTWHASARGQGLSRSAVTPQSPETSIRSLIVSSSLSIYRQAAQIACFYLWTQLDSTRCDARLEAASAAKRIF